MRRLQFKLSLVILRLANWVYSLGGNTTPNNCTPYFRAIDTKLLPNLGTKHSSDAYSYEGLQSLMKQEGEGYTLGQLFDESGWIELSEDSAAAAEVQKMITLAETQAEQAELNR